MKSYDKDQLLDNLKYTSLHVSKVNDLVSQYHHIHRVPFNSLTAILATIVILLLMWASGIINVVHVVMQDVAGSMVKIEGAEISSVNSEAAPSSSNSLAKGNELEVEEEPLIDLSFITSFFTGGSKYITSGVLKYAIIVALLDTLILVGISLGITYGGFYSYHYFKVKKNIVKLNKIKDEISLELSALDQSIIPEEYWHVPYLQRMQRYIEQNRADRLTDVLDLIDLDIRHQQIVHALLNDEHIDAKALSETVLHPNSKVLQKSRNKIEDKVPTNLAN